MDDPTENFRKHVQQLRDVADANATRSLPDMLDALLTITPDLPSITANLVRTYPSLLTHKTDSRGPEDATDFKLGHIVALSILSFLLNAYGMGTIDDVGPVGGDKRN